MFCIHCGSKIDDNVVFCTNCGAKQEEQAAPAAEETVQAPVAAPQVVVEPVPVAAPVIPQDVVMTTNWKNSHFDGGVLGLIGVSLAVFFLTLITLGLAGPAMYCYMLRWQYRHTVVGGYRLKFTGTGWQLFWRSIVWFLLTVITIGIFGLWVPIKYKKWEISHVEIDSVVPAAN